MNIERLFPFSMFFFLLSALFSAAASRSESRYSRAGSKAAYALGACIAFGALIARFSGRGAWFVADFFEGILLSIVLVGIVWIAVEARFSAGIDAALVAGLSLGLGVIGILRAAPPVGPPAGEASAHAFFVFGALAAFSLSFLFSVLFLVEDFLLKRKRGGRLVFRLPPLELTGRLHFAFLTLGTASLFAGVLGGVWIFRKSASARFFVLDPTAALSFIMLALYAGILMLRMGPLERGRSAAWVTVASYPFLLAVFLAAHRAAGGA